MHKKWSFPLRISLVNVTKSAVSSRYRNDLKLWWQCKWNASIISKVMMEYSSMILIGNSLPKELISLFFTNVSFYCSVFSISRQRRIQNSVKYQKSSFLRQTLYLRCLTGFWIPLCMTNAQSFVEHWNIGNIGKKLIAQISPWQILLRAVHKFE